MVVMADVAHFPSPGFVEPGEVRVLDSAAFLAEVLEEHQELMAAALEHLATNSRGVSTVADVLDEFDRNEALGPSWDLLAPGSCSRGFMVPFWFHPGSNTASNRFT